MTQRFYTKVSIWISLTIWGTIILTWALCFPIYFSNEPLGLKILVSIILGGLTLFLVSVFFNTYYFIERDFLHWVTGPFKGKIHILSIREITKVHSMMDVSSMMKPILSSKPLLIKYNKYDDMPFSPSNEKGFIEELRKVNSQIKTNSI